VKKRKLYIDILNIIAIIAVVAMHCNGIVHTTPMSRAWNTSLIVECICYFAVPLFFMISGANLMNYREKYDTKTFFKKRMLKVFIPLVAWSIIMLLWKTFIINKIPIETINTPLKFIDAILTNKGESTYYFMYEIIGVYMLMPLLSQLTKPEFRKTLWLIVVLFFVFNGLIPNLLTLVNVHWHNGISIRIGGYVIYAILGYLLSTSNVSTKNKKILIGLSIIGLIYRYSTTFILSKAAGKVITITWGYSSWHSILLTMSVFLLIKDCHWNKKIEKNLKLSNIIKNIANCSFGVYLIHLIIKYYFITLFTLNTASWQFRTFGVLVVYFISLLIVFLLKKVPIIKYIVP